MFSSDNRLHHYDLYRAASCKDLNELTNITQHYDLFISAYTLEEMINDVFKEIEADKKIWLVLPDYEFKDETLEHLSSENEMFIHNVDMTSDELELEYISKFIDKYQIIEKYKDKTICIDITGFVKPYMIYLLNVLRLCGFTKIDVVYSEPKTYQKQDETTFSDGNFIKVRSINGFEMRTDQGEDDLFIINAGYDYQRIINVASHHSSVKKQILVGFPSLQPIMYQENILNVEKASDELNISEGEYDPLFAPANDPFETAKVVDRYIFQHIRKSKNIENIYLAPLATKAHTLGLLLFLFYCEKELNEKGINIKIIYPFCGAYSPSSSKELFRINVYSLELD